MWLALLRRLFFEKNKKVFNARKQPIVDEINKHVDYFD